MRPDPMGDDPIPTTAPPARLPALDLSERFDAFTAGFRPVFPRADQFERFRLYVRGLLGPGERKNAAALAAAETIPDPTLAQALQHFVSHSPWDAERLFAVVRQSVPTDPGAVWAIHDGVFPKRGRHSVGVYRQFARGVGRKLNCQLAVVVAQVGPRGYFPLAVRLYLPAGWLADHPPPAGLIPDAFREPRSKGEVALSLLDELRGERPAPPVVAEDGYTAARGFSEGLAERGLVVGPGGQLGEAVQRFDWLKSALGLDHFEGRTWPGWHHHAGLVFAAYSYLAAARTIDGPPFPTLP